MYCISSYLSLSLIRMYEHTLRSINLLHILMEIMVAEHIFALLAPWSQRVEIVENLR